MPAPGGRAERSAVEIRFPPFQPGGARPDPVRELPDAGALERRRQGAAPLAVRAHAGGWRRQLKRDAETPYEYVLGGQPLPAGRLHLRRGPGRRPARPRDARRVHVRHEAAATASTSRARWRCCCGWAGSRRAWSPASRRAATPSASARGSCATPTPTPGSRRGSTTGAGSRSTRRPPAPRRARRSRRSSARRRPARTAATPASGDGGSAPRTGGIRPDLLGAQSGPGGAGGGAARRDGGVGVVVVRAGRAAGARARRVVGAARGAGAAAARPRRSTARSRELEAALRRTGRPAPAGTTLHQLEQRLGRTPEAAAYLRALRAGRYAPARVAARRPAARRALRRELASRPRAARRGCARCGRCRPGAAEP